MMPLLRAPVCPVLIKVELCGGSCIRRDDTGRSIQAQQILDARRWLTPRIARIKTRRTRAIFSHIRNSRTSHVRATTDAGTLPGDRHALRMFSLAASHQLPISQCLTARKIRPNGIASIKEAGSFAAHLSQPVIVSRLEEYHG